MSAAPPATTATTATTAAAAAAAPGKTSGKKKLIVMVALPLLLAAIGAGLWFGGILPPLLKMGQAGASQHEPGAHEPGAHEPGAPEGAHGGDAHGGHAAAEAKSEPRRGHNGEAAVEGKSEARTGGKASEAGGAIFVEMPDLVANLNAGPRRASYMKLRARLEVARPEDEALVKGAMPRLVDMFQTYLREMRPEELRGSAGTYRLREQLIARANVAAAPARVADVLFTEMLIQ